nr:pyrroline-5-carboxylate reductase [Woeseiaceae bacterium]
GFPAANISVAEPADAARKALATSLPGITICADNNSAAAAADCVVFAVKPQLMPSVCRALGATVQTARPLILSIAAGVRTVDIETWLGTRLGVIRVMPNQPALIRRGISGLYANERAGTADIDYATRIMSAVGKVVTLHDEALIDTVTAVSGSGPAYFFLLIDMLAKSATELGIAPALAETLAIETARGAAELAASESLGMDEMIARVRSPGGTTAAALDSLDAAGVRDTFARAIAAAHDRAVVLADEAHRNN